MIPRVLRHEGPDELVDHCARVLLRTLLSLQAEQDTVHLCLAGGTTANRIYEALAELVPESGLDPASLHLWWVDEQFLPTTEPARYSLQALSILARTLQLNTSQTHPMPASNGKADAGEAAFAYARELGDVVFDVCLLGMGADGSVASIFPGHGSMEPTSSLAVGVTDSPRPPAERITLTFNAINSSRRVWLAVDGEEKAPALRAALAGQQELPAAHVAGRLETLWFVDDAAAAELPTHQCSW